jgi:hypothetical protein
MAEEIRVGSHSIRTVASDCMEFEVHGLIEADAMAVIIREHDTRLATEGRLFVLGDLRGARGMSAKARVLVRDRPRDLPGYWVALVVGDFRLRSLFDLMARAASRLLGGKIVYRLFDEIEPARAWLSQMRCLHGR